MNTQPLEVLRRTALSVHPSGWYARQAPLTARLYDGYIYLLIAQRRGEQALDVGEA
jgi:hypothetical protein